MRFLENFILKVPYLFLKKTLRLASGDLLLGLAAGAFHVNLYRHRDHPSL